jgi:ADP-heptose:LPS heptosyltransferase
MKILVLQLARFGDLYLTWPTLRALHRAYPGAEIHLLVREKFAAGTKGLANVTVHTLPTATILGEPDACETRLEQWLAQLPQQWDQILNLSFSPFSSYLTDYLRGEKTLIRGYTRHADGYLAIPDDGSAYFYAQVGTDRPNRFHLADVFAMVAQVEITDADWGFEGELKDFSLDGPYVIVHLGASQSEKRYPVRSFRKLLQGLSQYRVYLVGSKEEERLAESFLDMSHVKSLIGQTTLPDLFSVLKNADLLIGADSAPIHIAAHMRTPVLNLSFSFVNFWETGPTSPRSWVVYDVEPEKLSPERVVTAARAMLAHKEAPADVYVGVTGSETRFTSSLSEFTWDLIRALYTQGSYPSPSDTTTRAGVTQLREIAAFALEQLTILKNDIKSKTALGILQAIDLSLTKLAEAAPELAPVIRWFETERLRLPPQDLQATFQSTESLFGDLTVIAEVLQQNIGADFQALSQSGLQRLSEIQQELSSCAFQFRLYQNVKAEPILGKILNHLTFFDNNGLHHAPQTKVEGAAGQNLRDWNASYDNFREVLQQMLAAFEKQDYVFVADLLEYEIGACLSQWRSQLVKFDHAVLI